MFWVKKNKKATNFTILNLIIIVNFCTASMPSLTKKSAENC